jgi:hypothetical protein
MVRVLEQEITNLFTKEIYDEKQNRVRGATAQTPKEKGSHPTVESGL